MTYAEFRTGLTFSDVRRMLWVDNPDPRTWRQKSRGVVLWHHHKIKQAMWEQYLAQNLAPGARAARRRRGRWRRTKRKACPPNRGV